MNKQTQEALKMAIEKLELWHGRYISMTGFATELDFREAINACKEALEQPAQEPVAWMGFDEIGNADFLGFNDFNKYTTKQTVVLKKPIPLYIHPYQWQGLTDDEILEIYASDPAIASFDDPHLIKFARAIEKRVGRKEWVSLTNEEIEEIQTNWLILEVQSEGLLPRYSVARAIEQALKEKNHGSS